MNERLKHPNAVRRFHVVRFRLLVRHLLNGFALLPFSCVILFAINSQTTVAAQTTAQASQRIAGVVLDQADAPVNGAEVSLMSGASELAGTITDEAGEFSFDAFVARETLSVVVRARGFQTLEQSWSGEKIGAAGLRLVLAPAPLSEELTVTATRTQTRLNETAASVVTLSAAELETTAAVALDDALRQVAGFQLFRRAGSRTANPTTQGVSLRATGASGASRALVLADGIPLNDPFGGWINWGRVPRESVSRVEVLRGGFSHLYGSGALGGVVNILTRRAATAPVIALEASYGSQRTPDASLFIGGRRGRFGATLAAEIFHTDGYIIVDEAARGRADTPAASRRTSLDLMLDYESRHDARLFFRASYFGESRANGTPQQTNRTHLRQWSAGGDWTRARLGSVNVRAYGGTQVYDQVFSAVAADRNSETLTRVQRVPSQFAGLSAQWTRSFAARHTLVAGLDAREVRGASDELVFAQGRAASLVGAGGRERSVGVFVEEIAQLTSRLTLAGGLRFDRWRNYRAQNASRPLTASAQTNATPFADRTETAFSPQASLLYKPRENFALVASVYRAFRQPTLNELYRSFRVGDVLTLANENLRAERLTGGEFGVNANSFKRRLDTRAVFFWTEIARPVANVTLNTTPALITRRRQNLGRTRSRGLELELDARLRGRWALSGSYLFADASVLKFPADAKLEGLRLPQVARHQLTFQLRYTNPARFNFGLQGRVAGAQFDDDLNRFRLERFFTLDVLASRRLTHAVELFAAVENLLDARYSTGRTPVRTVAPPAFLRLGLRFRLPAN
ncbi:MAG: iron complex outerrane recepter protein [Acidobacteriota bacterium]|nr:iron complex outerrane recepter protein [Acidobacteriota bacterium]